MRPYFIHTACDHATMEPHFGFTSVNPTTIRVDIHWTPGNIAAGERASKGVLLSPLYTPAENTWVWAVVVDDGLIRPIYHERIAVCVFEK